MPIIADTGRFFVAIEYIKESELSGNAGRLHPIDASKLITGIPYKLKFKQPTVSLRENGHFDCDIKTNNINL